MCQNIQPFYFGYTYLPSCARAQNLKMINYHQIPFITYECAKTVQPIAQHYFNLSRQIQSSFAYLHNQLFKHSKYRHHNFSCHGYYEHGRLSDYVNCPNYVITKQYSSVTYNTGGGELHLFYEEVYHNWPSKLRYYMNQQRNKLSQISPLIMSFRPRLMDEAISRKVSSRSIL